MAKKTREKIDEKAATKEVNVAAIPRKMTIVSFRTEKLLKEKAEAVFSDLGISTSAAINMFLKQVVRERGLPFRPSAQHPHERGGAMTKNDNADGGAGYLALEELWEELG